MKILKDEKKHHGTKILKDEKKHHGTVILMQVCYKKQFHYPVVFTLIYCIYLIDYTTISVCARS